MIDVMSISGTTPLSSARISVQRTSSPEAPSRVDIAESLNSTRIRVDNFLDLAIIEIRSNETGDVIRQYPTEMQIKSFQRATELQQRNTNTRQEQTQAVRAETFSQETTQTTNSSIDSSYSQTTTTPTPTIQLSTTPTSTAVTPPTPTTGETSTQSVVV